MVNKKIIVSIGTIIAVSTILGGEILTTKGIVDNKVLLSAINSSDKSTLLEQQEVSQINVTNVWNQKMFEIGLNSNSEIVVTPAYPMGRTNPYYTGKDAVIINVTNSENKDLYTYSGSGLIGYDVAYAFNGKAVTNGDIITITSNSGGIISDSNGVYKPNQSNFNSQSFMVENNKLIKIYKPDISINSGVLSLESKYYNTGKVIYKVNQKTYEGALINGKFSAQLPSGLPIDENVTVELITPDIHTIEYTLATQFTNQSFEQVYNMSRRGSINPKSVWGKKGNTFSLTAYQPIPITFNSAGGVISIDVKGPIKGTVNVDINNGTGGNKTIIQIPVNKVTNIKIPYEGAVFLDTSNVQSVGENDWEPFSFTTEVKVDSGFYRKIPVFDTRSNIKLFDGVYTNNSKFVDDITNPQNNNYPAIILGTYLVMYINDIKSTGLSPQTNFNDVVNLYNETFIEDNKINGLSIDSEDPIDKFHVNNLFVSTSTDVPAGTIYTGDGTGTYTLPSLFTYLLEPGWVVFHEIGHIFNPRWASMFLEGEVYSNMYTMMSQEAVQGSSNWLFNGNQKGFEDSTIMPIFQNYYNNVIPNKYLEGNYHTGLYYFYLLKEYYPDYTQELARLYSSQTINGNLPYNGSDFLVYAMANLYHVNIIPSLTRWGYNVTNQNLINYVIQNSTSSINLVPKNNNDFDIYNSYTVVPTFSSVQVSDNNGLIKGIDNPNTNIYIKYAGETYSVQTNKDGKFSISIPLEKNQNKAIIYAIGQGLKASLSQDITIDTTNVTNIANKEGLKNEIDIAKKIDIKEYNSTSVKILENTINEANKILENEDATQQEVNKSIASLQAVIKELIKKPSISNSLEALYWDGKNLVINGVVNGVKLSNKDIKTLEITNEYGQVISINGANVNWYGGSVSNYNGYQFVLNSILLNPLVGKKFTLKVNVSIDGQNQEIPISLTENKLPIGNMSTFKPIIDDDCLALVGENDTKNQLSTNINLANILINNEMYKYVNGAGDLKTMLEQAENIMKNPKSTIADIGLMNIKLENATSVLLEGNSKNIAQIIYWDKGCLVINGDIKSLNIPSDIEKKMYIINRNGKSICLTGANVNWYSGNSENYNGYQFIITPELVKDLDQGIHAVYVEFTLGGKTYDMPIQINVALPLERNVNYCALNNSNVLELFNN